MVFVHVHLLRKFVATETGVEVKGGMFSNVRVGLLFRGVLNQCIVCWCFDLGGSLD